MQFLSATYRIQFNHSFNFKKVKAIVPYLADLGVSHIYASPIFKATKGSPHGYDVVNPNTISAALGTESDFNELIVQVKKHLKGWIQDIVPNHMGFNGDNKWLMDVLEKGKTSKYYEFFDIEWSDTYVGLKGKLLAPFLGAFYGQCLENQEIQIKYGREGFSANYFDFKLPLKIETYPQILALHLDSLPPQRQNKVMRNYREILKGFEEISSIQKDERKRKRIEEAKDQLRDSYEKNRTVKSLIDKNIRLINGIKGRKETFTLLDDLLSKQYFRLTFWKFGAEEINYRRFFNINQLISVRVEKEIVFDKTHQLILKFIDEGIFSGLRVDHIDGLYDPCGYLKRLRNRSKGRWIAVEKILDHDEKLCKDWLIEGTTGYEFLNTLNNIFCCRDNAEKFDAVYTKFTGIHRSYDELVSSKKRLIIGNHMAGDVDNLAHHMKRVSQKDRHGSDITLYGLRRALVEVLTHFPVYRTYIHSQTVNVKDKKVIKQAVSKAKESTPALVHELSFIENILLLKFPEYLTEQEKNNWLHFVMRFQQFTGPLMAKGFEDTVLYNYNRLISLNEVGGYPDRFGEEPGAFYRFISERRKHWPETMNTTSTHDTKRGEDVRMRINVLSEIPNEWHKKLHKWKRLNKNKKTEISGRLCPDENDEYFFYQTLLGGFPFEPYDIKQFKERLKDYTIKAVREAKVHTAWLKPDENYEHAYLEFIDKCLKSPSKNLFLQEFNDFRRKVSHYGVFNSLSQALIKMTVPGICDFYQGNELWDLNFVDPDNRREVDFQKRSSILKDLKKKSQGNVDELLQELLDTKHTGHIKLFLTWKVLSARRENLPLFQKGEFLPLKTEGIYKKHIVAFARKLRGQYALVIAPRYLTKVIQRHQYPVGRVWKDTRITLPKKVKINRWSSMMDHRFIEGNNNLYIKDVLKLFPTGLLTNAISQ